MVEAPENTKPHTARELIVVPIPDFEGKFENTKLYSVLADLELTNDYITTSDVLILDVSKSEEQPVIELLIAEGFKPRMERLS